MDLDSLKLDYGALWMKTNTDEWKLNVGRGVWSCKVTVAGFRGDLVFGVDTQVSHDVNWL